MEDAYRMYNESRQQAVALTALAAKRPRSSYEMPVSHDISHLYAREDGRGGLRVIRESDSINESYDRYLQTGMSSYTGGEAGRSMSGGLGGHHLVDDPRLVAIGFSDTVVAAKRRSVGVGGGRPETPVGVGGGRPEIALPPDASSTLFVEGLPANCTRREVSHIFRPFVGYKEARLVTKDSRRSGGDALVLCFVDFVSPAHAATAMDALQGLTTKAESWAFNGAPTTTIKGKLPAK
ncbi:RNA-binding protein 1-like isoform X3 [Olea europaea var. sylvestris]|uniref:RNA-binding protein 1-like isoform X3 n=1 Tax=Olea europaea var. sylvestris TaxID=158386 RepID=UPI000C1CEACF|nr:RNA-binding protein 1-like isoform X3 [Olea europaea var. sylvestris]